MQKVLKVCHDFGDNLDNTFSNLLFIGQTCVGKTFLSNCIARALMDSCHSIIYLTAGEFFDSFKSDDFKEFGSSKFDTSFFVECDLLIIDDLEQRKLQIIIFLICLILLMKGFLEERVLLYLLTLRCLILRQGTHREFSRLVSAYSILRLFGDDIRCMKKLSPTKRS